MGNFTGNTYQVGLGIRDLSGTNSSVGGTASVVDEVTEMRLATVNDIAWGGAFQVATYPKSGRRAYLNQDYIAHYGSGTWTWDFDYLVDDQLIAQKLLTLINPTGAGNTSATANTILSNPVQQDVAHGFAGAFDSCGDITINAPIIPASGIHDEDRSMRSAILQNLSISASSGTDSGRVHMGGQFMSGYKPTIADNGVSIVAGAAGNEWDYSLFDLTTRTVCGKNSVTITDFTVNVENPATRVGWQGTAGETDGYVRHGIINVTASITCKLTSDIADLLDTWITSGAAGSPIDKATTAVTLENGSSWSISLPSVLITGYSQDQSNDGIFVTIDVIATGGSTGSTANVAVFKMT